MQILITGASGFLMTRVAEKLLESSGEVEITALDLGPAPRQPHPRVRSVRADIRAPDELKEALAGAAFDVVIHGAALSDVRSWERADPRRYLDVNVLGTANLLDHLRHGADTPKRIVHVSSNAVYGDGTPGSATARSALAPGEMYGISKQAGELVAHRYGELFSLPTVTLRPGKLFGPQERPTRSRALMSAPYLLMLAAMRDSTVRVSRRSLDASRDWLSATDAAIAVQRLTIGAGQNGATYDIAYGRAVPFAELVRLSEELAGAKLVSLDDTDPELDLDPSCTAGRDAPGDIRAAMQDLGWKPRDFATQFTEYFAWASKNKPLFTGHHQETT